MRGLTPFSPVLVPLRRILSLSNVEMVVVVAEDDWALRQALGQMTGRAITPSTVYRRQQRMAHRLAGESVSPSSAGQVGEAAVQRRLFLTALPSGDKRERDRGGGGERERERASLQ